MIPFGSTSGPPAPPVASCNPQYDDPTAASISSLQRTIFEAEAAYKRGEFAQEFTEQPLASQFGGPLLYNDLATDRAPFPVSSTPAERFEVAENVFTTSDFSMDTLNSRPMLIQGSSGQEYGSFFPTSEDSDITAEGNTLRFPSQILGEVQGQSAFGSGLYHAPAFIHDEPQCALRSSAENSGMRFKSPPPPADIASRRSKSRPAPLGTEALRDHTSMGPRTVSHSTVVKRMNSTPAAEMRRVASVGANLNVLGGRIQKSVNLSQRSPLQRHFSSDGSKFLQMNAHNIKQEPTMSGSLPHSGLAPPTPNSPKDRARLQQEEEPKAPSESSYDSDVEPANYILSQVVPGCFTTPGMGMTMASPPETPHNFQGGSHWGFDVGDEMIHTPGFGTFPGDVQLQMPQPQYVSPSSASQPATPAFGYFNGFPYTHSSPHFDVCSVDQAVTEYSFPEGPAQYPMVSSVQSSPEQVMQKTFTFHNATLDDFAGKSSSSPE